MKINTVEVWHLEDSTEIEETVNNYCLYNGLKPLSISVVYCEKRDQWVVSLVVERIHA